MLNVAPVEQLIAWSREPGLLPRIPAGPDRGKAWRDLTLEVVHALTLDRDLDVRFSATIELQRRGEAPPLPPVQPAQQLLI